MVWNQILGILDPDSISCAFHSERETNLFSCELLTEQESLISESILYFATQETLMALQARSASDFPLLSVILYCSPRPDDAFLHRFGSIACIGTLSAFNDAFSAVTALFRRSMQINQLLQDLVTLISSGSSLEDIAITISNYFRHPVCIYDNSFSSVAHSDIDGFRTFDTPDLINDILTGHVPPEIIRQVQREQNRDYARVTSAEPYLIHHMGGKFKHYSTPIIIGATTAGFFNIYMEPQEDLTDIERSYLPQIGSIISIVLQRTDFYSANKSHFFTSFFSAVLSGRTSPSHGWESRLKTFGYSVRTKMRVAAALTLVPMHSVSEMNNLASSLQGIFTGSIYCIRENTIILLCDSDPGSYSYSSLIRDHEDFFRRNSLRLGISSEFDSIYDMKIHYEEALSATQVGMLFLPDQVMYFYDSLRLFSAVAELGKHCDLSTFCYPPFLRLFRMDEQNGTELGKTLYLYLCDPKNPKKACEKLHIHKNTLYSRLEKIRSVMNVDITNIAVITQIFMTIVILRQTHQISLDLDSFYQIPFMEV